MNFNVIGMPADSAIGHILHLYDGRSDKDKLKLLLNNRQLAVLKTPSIDNRFKSGQTIDINAGEMLGLGLVVSYYDWAGESRGMTYQAVVGVEDSAKPQVENLLSDGGIWDDQTKKKMLVQQVMVQGYHPKTQIRATNVVEKINDKVAIRSRYPEHCALIINLYSEEGDIYLPDVVKGTDLDAYDEVFAVLYELPALDFAKVVNLKALDSPILTLALKRYPRSEEWQFGYDDALPYGKPK